MMWATRRPFLLAPPPPLLRLLRGASVLPVAGRPSNSVSFELRLFSSSSESATVANQLETTSYERHPWPEWVGFVDQLRAKGYFGSPGESSWDSQVYTDMNQLKEPCLTFARDRYDVFKSLSVPDIKNLVDSGCPNLLRKAVNSSKRLRAYLHLDEADVCGACSLRGSCDRAYSVLNGSDAEARTIDVVRVLLFYSLDPLVIKSETNENGREAIETATRKLLSELIELSNTPPNPSLPKSVSTTRSSDDRRRKLTSDTSLFDAEMKRGDWMCPKCEFMNFARNTRCLKCDCEGPTTSPRNSEMRKGDWICIKCKFINFSRNRECIKCRTEGPKRVEMQAIEKKKGDWDCPQCNFMNFASNASCRRCSEKRPKMMLKPGEWHCSSCGYLNFRSNTSCRKCNAYRPNEATEDEDEAEDEWRSPY